MSDFKPVNQPIAPASADPGEEFPFLHTITVVDRVVSVDKPELVQNNIRTETVTLNLDSEWDGLSCIINIGSGKTPTSLIWSGKPVIIPAELMTDIGTLNVSVVGYGDNGTVRAVTKKADAMLVVAASGYVHDDNPVPDPTTILGQLTEAADKANQAAQNAEDSTIDKVSVTMLPTGSGASGSVADKTLSLRIPNGPRGPQGPKGDPGDLTTVAHDSTLTGDGTSGTPLGVSDMIARKSELEQNINSFKATVSETYTTKDEFNNLQVGGTNLLAGTNNGTTGWAASTNGGKVSITAIHSPSKLVDYPRIEFTDSGSSWRVATYNNTSRARTIVANSAGKKFTLSFDAAVTSSNGTNKKIEVFFREGDATDNIITFGSFSVPNVEVWNHYELTGTSAGGSYTKQLIYFDLSTAMAVDGTAFKICNLKLEEGNKATPWSPAPEDFDGKYTSKTEFKQILSNYVPLSTYQALESRVQALEAKLANK